MAPPPPPPAPVRSLATAGHGETPRRSIGGRMKDPSPVGGGALFGTPTPSQVSDYFIFLRPLSPLPVYHVVFLFGIIR